MKGRQRQTEKRSKHMVLTTFAFFFSHEQAVSPPFSVVPSTANGTAGSCFAEN
jgi:hypothetical protein